MPLPSRSRAHAGSAIFTICWNRSKPLSLVRPFAPAPAFSPFFTEFSGIDGSLAEFLAAEWPSAAADRVGTVRYAPRRFPELSTRSELSSNTLNATKEDSVHFSRGVITRREGTLPVS